MFLLQVVLAGLASLWLELQAEAGSDREQVVIDATVVAHNVRSETVASGKWWLNRDAGAWGAPRGTVLMTGQPSQQPVWHGHERVTPAHQFVAYRVPGFSIDPGVSGWHHVYVGLYHENRIKDLNQGAGGDSPRLLAKISNEPFPEYLQAPPDATNRVAEVYWKAADLTGRSIRVEQPPAPTPHPGYGLLAGLSHIRLVPMSPAEVAEAQREIELPPVDRRLFGILDYTDEAFWWGRVDTEDDIRAIVYRHQQTGFGRIYWRCFGTHLDNSLAVPEAAARWTADDEQRWIVDQNCHAGWMSYIEVARRFDPLKVAVDYGKEIGCDVHACVRLTFNREPRANFWHEHPEFRAQLPVTAKHPFTGEPTAVRPISISRQPRALSMAYPEVRAFYLKFFRQIASTGTRGIMLDLLRHPPIAGCEPIVAEAFRKKYGTDICEKSLTRDPQVNEHLSQYLESFLRELRHEIGDEIEISIRCSGPDIFALRGKEWIASGLIDTIVDGNWYSGNAPRATIDATVAAVGSRGKAFAVAETFDVDPQDQWRRRTPDRVLSTEAIAALAGHYSGRGVDRFGLYESTAFTWYPDLRRAIRAAGWNYRPDQEGASRPPAAP